MVFQQPPPAASTQAALTPEQASIPDPPELGAGTVDVPASAGEPAGCLPAEQQVGLSSIDAMLAYADTLLSPGRSLTARRLDFIWNAYTAEKMYAGSASDSFGIASLDVSDVQDRTHIQAMLNALQTAGFVTWLRDGGSGLSILTVPLRDAAILHSAWGPYVQAYWQSRTSLPDKDSQVIPALKLPPCRWMVQDGFAPAVTSAWWLDGKNLRPDYARAAEPYLAPTSADAYRVAQSIDWLGPQQLEGPNTMCGPLVWSIMHDAGAFPPDLGNWSSGSKTFWIANPRVDGRPWSLFPSDLFHLYHFSEPVGSFDFNQFPLYPGDFLYLYSKKDGFDHMLLVSEVDAQGNVYSVSNLVEVSPQQKLSVERVILYNANDRAVGMMRNQWNLDGINGRTGHDGFDVFRWAWFEKDLSGQPVDYTVRPGDTFGLIAERWKTPADEIARYNGKYIEDDLEVGEMLQIPPVEY